jgi:hypothetical protein
MAAEKALRHLHSVSRQIDIDTIERIPIIGKADQLIAMVLLGKKLNERYANIECVAHECIEALKAKQNGTIEIDNPYTCQSAQHDSGADGDSVKQTPFSGMLQYDASTGELANANICLLEQRGFKVDDTIKLNNDDEGAWARPSYGWFTSFSGFSPNSLNHLGPATPLRHINILTCISPPVHELCPCTFDLRENVEDSFDVGGWRSDSGGDAEWLLAPHRYSVAHSKVHREVLLYYNQERVARWVAR